MGFSQTFLQGFQVGSQKKLQQEAQMRQAERDKQQAALDLEELKLRQGAARIADQKARFDADLHPLELEKAIQEAGLVPADVAGEAPGGGAAAGPLPPPAALGQPSGAPPSAPMGVGTGAGVDETAPEPAPRTMSDVLNIGGKSFRRKTLKERLEEVEGVAGAKAGAEAKAKAQYDYLPEDVTIDLPGGPVTIRKGTPISATGPVVSGTVGMREGAARNATALEAARIGAASRERVADVKAQSSAAALKKNGDGSWSLASDIVNVLRSGGGGAAPSTRAPLSSATRNTIDKSAVLLDLKNDAQQQLDDPEVAQFLGPANGRITSVQQLIGNPDERAQKLFGTLTGIAALSLGIHSFRNAQEAARITDEFFKSRYEPAAIRGALEGLSGAARHWENLGVQHGYDVSGNAAGAAPGAAPPSGIVIKSIRPKN